MTKLFFEVLRKEKWFLIPYAILTFAMFIFGGSTPLSVVFNIIGSFTMVTIAHNQYQSVKEKVICVFLAMLCMLITVFAGFGVDLVIAKLTSDALTGFFLLALRNLVKKI